VVDNFVEALRTGDQAVLRTTCDEALESHIVVFAAERARLTRQVVDIAELTAPPIPAGY
jgi:hypothetical protein